MYTVIGADGEKLKSCKSLASAQKLADKECGIVLENGEQIYPIENVHENDGTLPYEVMVRINIRSKPSLEADKIDIADAGTMFYIANEGISIIENADRLGIPIPEFVRQRFLNMKKLNSKKERKKHEV